MMSFPKKQSTGGLLLFTRYPQPGKVKTRLVPKLGANGAARIHRQLTEYAVNTLQPFTLNLQYHLSVYYTGGTESQMRDWLGHTISFREQCGQDLGQRMAAAFRSEWARGSSRAVLLGSDCPAITIELLTTAFARLNDRDLVIGPTFDGGYYLIGMNHSISDKSMNSLFEKMSWGTADVYSQTLDRAEQARLSLYTLPRHHDIDRPEDLEYFNHNPDTE